MPYCAVVWPEGSSAVRSGNARSRAVIGQSLLQFDATANSQQHRVALRVRGIDPVQHHLGGLPCVANHDGWVGGGLSAPRRHGQDPQLLSLPWGWRLGAGGVFLLLLLGARPAAVTEAEAG